MSEARLSDLVLAFRGSLRTVEERTEFFLREAILSGDYKPGERLRQSEIADLLGVSRMPVRASLRKLEAQGLVEIKPNIGAVVCALRAHQIAEIYELRVLLETYLLRHAAARLGAEDLDRLSAQLASKTEDGKGPLGWSQRHSFYHDLYEFADRPRALELADQLRLGVGRYLLQRNIDEYNDAHGDIVRLLKAGDSDGAATLLETHLGRVSVELQQLVTRNPDRGEQWS